MNRRTILKYCVICFLAFWSVCCSCRHEPEHLVKVRLQLNWSHEVEFVGYYVAEAMGFYEEEGLDVEIIPAPNGMLTAGPVLRGEAEFGIMDQVEAVSMEAKPSGVIMALAAIFQACPHVFIVHEDSGIHFPKDFEGKSIGIKNKGWKAVFEAMMNNLGLDPDKVERVGVSSDMTPFYKREVDIWTGYSFSEPIEMMTQGYEIETFPARDYGFLPYSGMIITSESFMNANLETAEKFVRATIKGWEYAFQHPREAVEITLKFAPGLDREFQLQGIRALIPLIHTGEQGMGWIDQERFDKMMLQLGLNSGKSNLKVDNRFVGME